MDSLTFTINFDDINDPDEPQQVVDDLKLLFRFLMNANPNYYLIGNMLYNQLNEQEELLKEETKDPRDEFRKKLDEMCPFIMEAMNDTDLKNLYAELKSEIGEAMGPVCYAAHKLARELMKHDCAIDWVFKFVDYYEENWKF